MLPKKIVVLNNGGHRPDSRVWRVASARVLGLRTPLQILIFHCICVSTNDVWLPPQILDWKILFLSRSNITEDFVSFSVNWNLFNWIIYQTYLNAESRTNGIVILKAITH